MGYAKPKTKHKITAAVDEDLRILAKTLPESIKSGPFGQPITTIKHVTGASMLKKGQTKLEDGSRVNANSVYMQSVPVKVNHIMELYYHYQKNGMEGVDNYVSMVKHHEKLRSERTLKALPWYRRWLKKVNDFMSKVNDHMEVL